MAGLAGIAEKYTGEALAFGLGLALGRVLEPIGTALAQDAWSADGAQIRDLDPAVLALAVVRGLIDDHGILPVAPPTGSGKVPAFPRFAVDAIAEAAAHGYDRERFAVMVGNMGRPASPEQAAHAEWRGKIEHVDYLRAIAEGDVRNEWAEAIFEAARAILTPHEWAELHLRGFVSKEQRDEGAGEHGMRPEHTQLLYDVLGRSVNVHAVTTGLARGGKLGGSYADVPEPYRSAIQRSNIREEWAGIAYANRYVLPSVFAIRTLAQSGDLTEADTLSVLLESGWKPDLAAKVSAAWHAGKPGKGDPHVAKAESQLWTTIHKSYLDSKSTEAEVKVALTALGVTAPAQVKVLALWNHEREIVRRTLTPKEIKKAIGLPGLTLEWALRRLEELGYSAVDAASFLAE